jgi:SAM-dependent methyltransferase
VNVGAGTGNYEPRDRPVVAVEPSLAMVTQRPPAAPPVIRGVAESLPLPSQSLDAAMAVLTLHHWLDLEAGLHELSRVAPRQVIYLFDTAETDAFWGWDYFPEARQLPSERRAPDVDRIARTLRVTSVTHVLVPFDCTDGFGAAFWGRPEAYLDPAVHAGMSFLSQLSPADLARGTARLNDDLRSGRWDERLGHLRQLSEFDIGYRIVVAEGLRAA